MADPITFAPSPAGSFDTALLQVTQANAQALAANTNQMNFLNEIAKSNDEVNAQALTGSGRDDLFATNDVSEEAPSEDPLIDPAVDPALLPLFSQIETPAPAPEATRALQLQNLAVLQRDAELLEEAATTTPPAPLTEAAATVDLSPDVQAVVEGESVTPSTPLTSDQMLRTSQVLQSVANEPLTPALLERIQSQLAAMQNPIRLSLATLTAAMNYIASMQAGQNPVMANTAPPTARVVTAVTPVAPVDEVAIEDSAIR